MSRNVESRAALRELVALIQELDEEYLCEDRRITEAADVAEGQHMVLHLLKAGLDVFVDNDSGRPRLAPLAGPTLKWGGEGADNPAFCAPLDTRRRYRIWGRLRDEVYLNFTVYKGKAEGDWNEGVVSALNHRQIEIAPDGSYEVLLSVDEQPGNWLRLEPGVANSVITRHYFENEICAVADPTLRIEIDIETQGEPSFPRPLSPQALADKMRAAIRFVRGQTLDRPAMDPSSMPTWFSLVPNELPKPEKWQPTAGGGAGAVDNAYCAGLFVLDPDQALVIEGRLPECVYANVMLWNRYMQGLDYRYRPTSLNRTQMTLEADQRFRLVVAHERPDAPNWLDTEGRPNGFIYWRFLLPEGDIEQPRCQVVPFASLSA
jgi:hypothetical protein